MNEYRIYDASLPLFAAWSLESPIFTAAVLIQPEGNENRVIASAHWKLKPLHTCLADIARLETSKRWAITTHVTPPDADQVFERQFVDYGFPVEAAPKIHDSVVLTRRLFATLRIQQDGNLDLIESINTYAPREEPQGFVVTAGHNLERFYVRALEIFAAWRHAGGGQPADAWGPPPEYRLADRARI